MDSTVKASYEVAYLIAKTSEPLTDGEFIKPCIERVADINCPKKVGDISKISLSHQTIARQLKKLENLSKEVWRVKLLTLILLL